MIAGGCVDRVGCISGCIVRGYSKGVIKGAAESVLGGAFESALKGVLEGFVLADGTYLLVL